MFYYAISGLINGVVSNILGIFVYTKNTRNTKYISFGLLCASLSIWNYSYFMWQIASTAQSALFWSRMLMVGTMFIPSCSLYHTIKLIDLEEAKRYKLMKLVLYSFIIDFGLLCFIFSPLFIQGVSAKMFFKYWPNPGILFHPLLLKFFTVAMYSWYLLYKEFNVSKGLRKKQFQILFIATLIGYAGGSINFFLFYNIPIPPITHPLVSVYIFLLAYGILQYRLLDIEVIIRRAVIFAGLFGFVFFVFALTAGLAQMYLSQIISSKVLALAISVLAITAFYEPLKNWLISLTDRFLFQKEYDYQTLLNESSKDMSRITDMRELLASIVHIFSSKLRLDNAGIYLLDKEVNKFIPQDAHIGDKFNDLNPINSNIPLIQWLEQSRAPLVFDELEMLSQGKNVSRAQQLAEIKTQMKALGASVIVPSFTENTLSGFLILGDKLSGRVYTQEDLNVLQVLSNQAALAIENCQFWQDVVEKERKARLQEMDAYSYSLAHEIDNPMQVILGQAGFLKMDLLKDIPDENKKKEVSDSLNFIVETAKRVSGMVKAIRDFGQKITGEFRPINIEDVVDTFSKLYYPQFKDKTVVYEKISQLKGPVYVKGEKPELMQALVILANNAIHAMKDMKDKKVFLSLSLLNHSQVRIVFSDNGYGIKKDMLSVIFTPFTTTKVSTEGTGMGLYNAKKIIERHKGKIWAESEGPGKGASFIIELPVLKDVSEAELKQDTLSSKRMI